MAWHGIVWCIVLVKPIFNNPQATRSYIYLASTSPYGCWLTESLLYFALPKNIISSLVYACESHKTSKEIENMPKENWWCYDFFVCFFVVGSNLQLPYCWGCRDFSWYIGLWPQWQHTEAWNRREPHYTDVQLLWVSVSHSCDWERFVDIPVSWCLGARVDDHTCGAHHQQEDWQVRASTVHRLH